MTIYYSVYYECENHCGWEEYVIDDYDRDQYNEMISDIKATAREYGGGDVSIDASYEDGSERFIDELHVTPCPAAIYKCGDRVSFLLDGKSYEGTIGIVDAFGTFFDNSQPHYDIDTVIQEEKIFVKHVPQSCIRRLKNA